MNTARFVVRSLLIAEMGLLFLYSLVGSSGIAALRQAQKENSKLKQELLTAQDQLTVLIQYKKDWDTFPFYKEQFIREELQMAKKGDELYLIS